MKKTFVMVLCIILSAATFLAGCGAANKLKAAGAYSMTAETAAYDMEEVAAEAPLEYDGGNAVGEIEDPNRKLIREVYLNLEAKDILPLVDYVEKKVRETGGYIESKTLSTPQEGSSPYGARKNAYYTVHVPSDRLDAFLSDIEGEGCVTYKSENVRDVTLQYSDLESHLESLKTEQKRLNELMNQATSVEDLIAIESRLSDIRYELESYESQRRTFDNQIDYSTVTIDIMESDSASGAVTGVRIAVVILALALAVFIVVKVLKKNKNKKKKAQETPGETENKEE